MLLSEAELKRLLGVDAPHFIEVDPSIQKRVLALQQRFALFLSLVVNRSPTVVRTTLEYAQEVMRNHHVVLAVGQEFEHLDFLASSVDGALRLVIQMPATWSRSVLENPLSETGAMVYIGSQVADGYNERFEDANERAWAHLREFFQSHRLTPPVYWKEHLRRARSLAELLYTFKPIKGKD